ncbi:hypothetical protein EAF04_007500 [Stromatinia cepivora]|nr:hypothetical protein EAF04_007500 [Stromatinia cepivora]
MRTSLSISKSDETLYAHHETISTYATRSTSLFSLTVHRNKQVRGIMNRTEWLSKTSVKEYEQFSPDFAIMVDCIGRLMELYENIIEYIPTPDTEHDQQAYLTIPDVSTFYRQILRFMNSLIPTKIPEYQMRLQKLIARLENLSTIFEFLDFRRRPSSEFDASDEPSKFENINKICEVFIEADSEVLDQ